MILTFFFFLCDYLEITHKCDLIDDLLAVQEGETVELRVIREQGQLLNQLIRYTVIPSGNAQFYGATGILEFQPGEREVMVALVAKPDGIPEVSLQD